jgi:hypothetical protein
MCCPHLQLTGKPGQPDENTMPKKCFNFSSTAFRLMTLTLIALVFVERPLHAYADPGSGLLAWQLLGAVVVGAMYQLRRVIRRIRGFGASDNSPDAIPQPPSANPDPGQAQGRTRDGLFLS